MKKIIRTALFSACFAFGISQTSLATNTEQTTSFTPAQVNQLHKIIRDYLVANPQVLVEASQVLQEQQQKKMEEGAITAIGKNKAALFDDSQSPSIGSADAPATLVEFFDYQCGHCKEMASIVKKLASEDKNLYVIFKELPIFGAVSANAAKIALAASMQPGKYYAFHNLLLNSNQPLTNEQIMALAKKAGLNIEQLKKDMDSPAIAKEIRDNFKLAQALKVMGTPTFVISDKAHTKFAYIPGATSSEDLQKQIKSVQ